MRHLKRLLKRLLKTAPVQWCLAGCIASYLRLCLLTARVQWPEGFPEQKIPPHHWSESGPRIVAFWHGRMAMAGFATRDRARVRALISRHGDGSFISRIMRLLGFRAIRGSTERRGSGKHRGGASALRQSIAWLRQGGYVAITPDGPRGPARAVQGQIIELAAHQHVPILPLTFSASRAKILPGWDQLMLPLPFGRLVIEAGEPIFIPPGASAAEREKAGKRLEDTLNRITARADQKARQS